MNDDLLIKDFKIFISNEEKQRVSDLQIAMGQAMMFGGDTYCDTCGRMILMKTELDICDKCIKIAVDIYKYKHKQNFLE